jgi:hypothetical protein
MGLWAGVGNWTRLSGGYRLAVVFLPIPKIVVFPPIGVTFVKG